MPEPDALVVRGVRGQFTDRHPTEAVLIVEVSDSTLTADKTTKASLYARAEIPEYWIVNLVDEQVEVLRRPAPSSAGKFGFIYLETVIHRGDDQIAPLAAPDKSIRAAALLPWNLNAASHRQSTPEFRECPL